MCLVRVLAVLKATEIVARRCIFAERGALEDGHPIVARRSGAARRVDTSMSILGRRIQKGFRARVRVEGGKHRSGCSAMPLCGIVLPLFKRQVDSVTMLSSPLAVVCLHKTYNGRIIILK